MTFILGYVVSCNHRIADYDKFDIPLGNHFLNGNRAKRLVQIIKEKTASGGKLTMVSRVFIENSWKFPGRHEEYAIGLDDSSCSSFDRENQINFW